MTTISDDARTGAVGTAGEDTAARDRPARALVVLATYDERDNLPEVLQRIWAAADCDVLVVDDGSPDGTGRVADRIATLEPRLTVIHRPRKSGLASAVVLGCRTALERGYDVVVEMDADLSHPPEALPALIAACAEADAAIGSRLVAGGRFVGRPWWRVALTAGACVFARRVLGLTVHDCTSGYRCLTAGALREVDLGAIRSQGYGFLIEMDWAMKRAGHTVVEIPIVFRDRTHGVSKMTAGMIPEAMAMVLRLRLGLVPAALTSRSRLVGTAGRPH